MHAAPYYFLVTIYDIVQKKHAILRNFPIIGHFRYLLETIGPELRQYIVTSNNEERPFSRDQRTWIYASSKKQNNYFGFGTDDDLEGDPNHLIIKQAAFPLPELRDWRSRVRSKLQKFLVRRFSVKLEIASTLFVHHPSSMFRA